MNDELHGTTSPIGSHETYTYALVVATQGDKLLLCRHQNRTTWEMPGGHIEPGETPLQAARRELFEESGATRFSIHPVCDYSAAGTHGVVFFAQVQECGPLPQGSEMAEVRLFDRLPDAAQITYPGILPVVYARVMQQRAVF